ncbi:MAG TPA: TonB-dependent receptor [Gemmatimonadaceae bacterium]|nr:TonB-dependent receptor [Gemmatimonadaceae bacterium]
MAFVALFLSAPRASAQEPVARDSGGIAGHVRTSGGRPVAGASVALAGSPSRAITDSVGAFAMPNVAPGTYTLIVVGPTIAMRTETITVLAAGVTRIDVTVERATGDTVARGPQQLPEVVIRAGPPAPVVGPLPEVRGTLVFSGKKTESLQVDSVPANTAQNITREVYSRIPGLNVSESENSGFPSNGIGFRGLNPIQSIEMNTRQNGVNIVADLYGYPETYYAPPTEALARVEFVRGSSSLQFGPQFGGVVNYVLRDGQPNTAPTFDVRQSFGSFAMFDSYGSLSGGSEHWTYFAYAQYRGQTGYRPNSDLSQLSAAATIAYAPNDNLKFRLEYSLLRNRIHMPGGLDNEEFNEDPEQSFRARNWLSSPWNIIDASVLAKLSPSTTLTSSLSFMFSQRYLVWRNEDGGASAPDTIDPVTLAHTPREVEWEYFDNVTNETRLSHSYQLLGGTSSLATGIRIFAGDMRRQEGGEGTTGSDFDMTLVGPYETDMKFRSANVAVFAENVFRITSRLSITPGVRAEYLRSTAEGYTADTTVAPLANNRTFPLAGIGAQFHATVASDIYANITQAYRPIEYSFLTPFGSTSRVDPNLHDPKGYNADIGWRGSLGRGGGVSFDVGAFYLAYNGRIGLVSGVDSTGAPYTEWRNVADAVNTGVEAYVQVQPFALLGAPYAWGTLTIFDALGYTHARYTSGEFDGNTVEFAPAVVNRVGVSYEITRFSTSFLASTVTQQFSDANNTVASYDADVGIIPGYTVLDWSATFRPTRRTSIRAGVNNLANISYFTFRTTEYPGPGIIPAIGRSVYVSLGAGF